MSDFHVDITDPAVGVFPGGPLVHRGNDQHGGSRSHPCLAVRGACQQTALVTRPGLLQTVPVGLVVIHTGCQAFHITGNHVQLQRIQGACRRGRAQTLWIRNALCRPEQLADSRQLKRCLAVFAHRAALLQQGLQWGFARCFRFWQCNDPG